MGEIKEAEKLIKWLVIITVIIILLNIINELAGKASWQINRLISVANESNFSTWFSSALLAIAAFFAYKCSISVWTQETGRTIWQILSLGFLAMSCDEVAVIHENLGSVLDKYFFNLKNLYSPWIVILGPFILLLIFIFALELKKYLKGSNKAMRFLFFGALTYIGGAFIFESTINFFDHSKYEWLYKIEYIAEESFEMFGAILIIKGLIEHCKFLLVKQEKI